MMATLLKRAIGALCLGGMAFGMHAAVAQETTVTLQHAGMTQGERWVEEEVNYSDPEGEVGNGSDPPIVNPTFIGDADLDASLETDNFPETEVGNGTYSPT